MDVLIVYGTTEGHARHLSENIQSLMTEVGAQVTIREPHARSARSALQGA